MTETDEMPIHELASVVRMEGDDLPRIPAETGLQGSDHIDLCLRPYRSCLGPSRAPICDREGPVEVSCRLPSIMTHQVHGQGTKDIQGKHPLDTVTSSGGGSMHVWMGILPPRGVLRVWEIPCRRYICRSVARSLPMVAGLICRRSLQVSSSIGRCPWVTRFSMKRAIPAAPFLSQGPAVFCHCSGTFSHEFTKPFQVHNR